MNLVRDKRSAWSVEFTQGKYVNKQCWVPQSRYKTATRTIAHNDTFQTKEMRDLCQLTSANNL